MPTAADKQILDIIGDRLANISTANGYVNDIEKISRGRIKPWDNADIPAINYWPTSHSAIPVNYRVDEHTLTIGIEAHSLTRDDPFPNVVAGLAADITTALNRDTGAPAVSDTASINFGGSVNRVNLVNYDYEIGEGQSPRCGVLMVFDIIFRSPLGDMYSISI